MSPYQGTQPILALAFSIMLRQLAVVHIRNTVQVIAQKMGKRGRHIFLVW